MGKLDAQIHWVLEQLHLVFYFGNKISFLQVRESKPFPVHAGEVGSPPYFMQSKILRMLNKQKVISLEVLEWEDAMQDLSPSERVGSPKGTYFRIKPLQPKFEQLRKEYEKKAPRIEKTWITKDPEGNYYFDGKQVLIKRKDTAYFIVFDATFLLCPQGGEVRYKDIIQQAKLRGYKTDIKGVQQILTISAASFFRWIEGIPRLRPDNNQPFFIAKNDAKSLIFNNKR